MSVPPLPIFLPIAVTTDEDTQNMPVFDSMKGNIVPAIFDLSGNIINNPTPFYILCNAKIINPGNQIPSLPEYGPDGLVEQTYEQLGLVQGNKLIFPPTNGGTNRGDNTMTKNQFGLCPFPKAFTQEIYTSLVQKDPSYVPSSPGLLVPVYCYQDTGVEFNSSVGNPGSVPAFFFFRADVFWEGAPPTGDTPYDAYASKIPNFPLGYNDPSFPVPFGKNKSNIYYLSSVYSFNYNDNNRVGTWSFFNTLNQINYINIANNFTTGPAAAPVSIAFNLPRNDPNTFAPVKRLSTSQLYTVYKMNQYNTTQRLTGGDIYIQDWCAQYIDNNGDFKCIPFQKNLGYPLNFLYQIGSNSNFKNSIGYSSYYQPGVPSILGGSYQGTICQAKLPFNENYEDCTNYWDIATISKLYQGNDSGSDFNIAIKNIIGGTIYSTSYTCNCAGSNLYNGTCFGVDNSTDNKIISDNESFYSNTQYYTNTCNSVHAGIYQFTAFQFIPINFYSTPPQRSVPPIGPTGYQSFPGKTGPTGITGPTTTNIPYLTNVQLGVPTGPTGYGNYTISFPFNTDTGAANPFPNTTISNLVPNITLGNSLSSWVVNPSFSNCPDQTSPSHPQCGYQDYYHSLLGRFYTNPQNLPVGTICGLNYTPPWYYDGIGPTGGCTGGTVCVPNYKFLQDISNPQIKPFTCQLPQATAPYPQSINGFNFTYDNITPITWENLSNYLYVVPPGIPTQPLSFKKLGYYNGVQAALTNVVDPTTNKTQQKSPNTIWIVLIVLIVLVVIILIFYFFLRSSSSVKPDLTKVPFYPKS